MNQKKKQNQPLGYQLADMRLKRNMTQLAVAEASGLSLSSIKCIETLRREPSNEVVSKICKALNCEYIQQIKSLI